MQSAPLSKTGKMPWFSWNLDAKNCKTAKKQVKKLGKASCKKCYAKKGRYVMKCTVNSMEENLLVWKFMRHAQWVATFVSLLSDRLKYLSLIHI